MDASAGSRRRRTETMTIQQGISGRRRRGDGGGDGVTRVVFKERGDGGGGGVSTRVSSFCSILRAVGFSLWKAQRACLFVARKLSFTIWAILHASLLQMEKKSFLSSWTMGQVHVFILNSKTGYMRCSDSRYRTYDLASSDVQTFYDFGCSNIFFDFGRPNFYRRMVHPRLCGSFYS